MLLFTALSETFQAVKAVALMSFCAATADICRAAFLAEAIFSAFTAAAAEAFLFSKVMAKMQDTKIYLASLKQVTSYNNWWPWKITEVCQQEQKKNHDVLFFMILFPNILVI